MNLIVDVGNTQIKWAVFHHDNLKERYVSLSRENFVPQALLRREFKASILSASGLVPDNVREFLRTCSDDFLEMNAKTNLPIKLVHKTPNTLGLDRKAACVGASVLYPDKHCLIFDAGSALTVDFLHAEKGMMGGNISPGLSMRFSALHNFTAKLPLLSPKETENIMGFSTDESIINGVQNGIIFEIKAYLTQFSEKYSDIVPIITGGDAQFFVKKLKSGIFAQPYLNLIGLNRILKYYAENK